MHEWWLISTSTTTILKAAEKRKSDYLDKIVYVQRFSKYIMWFYNIFHTVKFEIYSQSNTQYC